MVVCGEQGVDPVELPVVEQVQQALGPCSVTDWGQVDDHGHVLLLEPDMPPRVLVDPYRGDAIEAAWVIDQEPSALGRDRIIRGRPGNA